MAEHLPTGPAELGAPMDYAQHERTYHGFLNLVKVTILATVVTLVALALFAFGTGGFWLGVLLLLMMTVAAIIGLFGSGSVKPLIVVTIIGFLLMAISLG
jgi:hypothetical protein